VVGYGTPGVVVAEGASVTEKDVADGVSSEGSSVASGRTMLRVADAPHSSREVPSGQQPASVQK
jgi:hypothetical protein